MSSGCARSGSKATRRGTLPSCPRAPAGRVQVGGLARQRGPVAGQPRELDGQHRPRAARREHEHDDVPRLREAGRDQHEGGIVRQAEVLEPGRVAVRGEVRGDDVHAGTRATRAALPTA